MLTAWFPAVPLSCPTEFPASFFFCLFHVNMHFLSLFDYRFISFLFFPGDPLNLSEARNIVYNYVIWLTWFDFRNRSVTEAHP